jgi:NADH dehydrogenase
VQDLLDRGEAVRALVRPAASATALQQAGAEIAWGDLREPASLDAACRGVRTVISTASATNRSDDTPENVDGRGTQHLIDAARKAGVEHFILLSTVGASPDSMVPAFRAKAAAEAHLKQSGFAWTIIQPAGFMGVWFGMMIELPLSQGQPVTLVGESRHRHSFIAEKDVAAFVVAATRNPAARNATLVLGGPAAVTFREVVQAYEQETGRTIPVRSVAPGAPIPLLPEPVWGIAAALESFDTVIPMTDLAQSWGVPLTSAREFARTSRLATPRH